MGKICIAIDGTSASGKSSTATAVAHQLGYRHLSTGLLYRAVAVAVQRAKISVDNEQGIADILSCAPLGLEAVDLSYSIYLGDELLHVSHLESVAVARLAAQLSALASVRAYLLPLQQGLVQGKGLVLDGRDIATVVLPDAELKVFLSAPLSIRAARRLKQLQKEGLKATRAEVEQALATRDEQDSTRSISPMQMASSARAINTAEYTQREQVELILQWVTEVT